MWIIRAADSSALDAALDRLDEDTTISVWPQEEPARAAAQRLVDLFWEAMQEAATGHARCQEALRQLGACLGGHPAPQPAAPRPAVPPERLN